MGYDSFVVMVEGSAPSLPSVHWASTGNWSDNCTRNLGGLLGGRSVFFVFVGVIFLLPFPHTAGDAKALFSVLRLDGYRFNFIAARAESGLAMERINGDGSINDVPATPVWDVPRRRSA